VSLLQILRVRRAAKARGTHSSRSWAGGNRTYEKRLGAVILAIIALVLLAIFIVAVFG
jgi:hypothetical protein